MDIAEHDLSFIQEYIDKVFFRKPTEKDKVRNKEYKQAFEKFADSGWLPPHLPFLELSIPDIVMLAQKDADTVSNYIYSLFMADNSRNCKLLIRQLKKIQFVNSCYFNSAMLLYKQKEYLGCCMMIFALIEQLLRYGTKKDGDVISKANPFLTNVFGKGEANLCGYNAHPTKYLMGASLKKVLTNCYKNAEGFERNDAKDRVINRNYLLHGMTKRKYEHIDCIKLFVILEFIGKYGQEACINAQSTT